MIDKWTFGIITGGNETQNVNKIIDSIEKQNIPLDKYEIIIVGGEKIPRNNIVHIEFDESQKKMWITKKKNIICQNAKFQNIALTHDYVFFHDGWYDGWLKFGDDNWDVAMNVILNGDGSRFRDWLTQNPLFLVPYNNYAFLKSMYISGTYWCAKKDYMLKHPLNENKVWGEWEDVEWSFAVRDTWNYKCNPYSTVQFMKSKVSYVNQNGYTVADSVHYALIEQSINKNLSEKVVHLDSRLAPCCNTNLHSIHYVEFDFLRNFIRKNKPKRCLVIGTADGMSTAACSWAMKDIGGKVDSADSYMLENCNNMDDICRLYDSKFVNYDSRCYVLNKEIIKHFDWSDTTTLHICNIPHDITSVLPHRAYDFVFIDHLAMDHFRLELLDSVKHLLADSFILFLNTRGENISNELQNWARINLGSVWENEMSSLHIIRK